MLISLESKGLSGSQLIEKIRKYENDNNIKKTYKKINEYIN